MRLATMKLSCRRLWRADGRSLGLIALIELRAAWFMVGQLSSVELIERSTEHPDFPIELSSNITGSAFARWLPLMPLLPPLPLAPPQLAMNQKKKNAMQLDDFGLLCCLDAEKRKFIRSYAFMYTSIESWPDGDGSDIIIILAVDLRQDVKKGLMSQLAVTVSNEAAIALRKNLCKRLETAGWPVPPQVK